MTGYLQRLAMGVRAPSRLHPFVGSMFAGPPSETAAPLLPRADPIAESEGRAAGAPASTTAAVHAEPPPDTTPSEPADAPTARAPSVRVGRRDQPPIDEPRDGARNAAAPPPGEARSDTRDGFRPLLARVETEAEAPAGLAEIRHAADAYPAPSRSQPLAPRAGRSDPVRATPDVPPTRAAARPGEIVPPPAPARVPGAVRKLAGEESRAPAGPRQPSGDDIHIHIGRVEVTAVPAPAPRSAAAPARKTMTLEEYLGRRNGASR
jgi:hypothetical protein